MYLHVWSYSKVFFSFPPPSITDKRYTEQWLYDAAAEYWGDYLDSQAIQTLK